MENLDSLNTVDFLIFPTLDIDPSEKRENLATMIKDLFQWVFAGGKASLKKKGETGLISIVSKPIQNGIVFIVILRLKSKEQIKNLKGYKKFLAEK